MFLPSFIFVISTTLMHTFISVSFQLRDEEDFTTFHKHFNFNMMKSSKC
jgi:hypothetical protein